MLIRVGSNLKTLPLRHLGGGAISALRVSYTGTERYNISIGYGIDNKLSGLPRGHLAPSSWILPYKSGDMSSSKEARIVFLTSSLNVAEGVNLSGTAPIQFTVDGNASSVASLIGTTNIVFSTSGNVSAPFNMVGNSNLIFTTSGNLRADASITGTTSFSFESNLTTYAIANLIAVPISTALTPESISTAVWSATSSLNNLNGSMGEKLNDAGGASNPWTEVIESGLTAAEILKIILSVQAGKTTIDETTVKFKSVDGVTDRVIAEMTGSERINIILDGN